MRPVFNVGILGTGFMGKTHAFSYMSIPYFYDKLPFDVKITAVCSGHFENALSFADEYSVEKAYASEDEIINSDHIDIIDICTPNIYHYETAKKAILRGKHVLIEKPLCITTAQADELAYLANQTDKKCGMVFNNRFLLPVIRAKEIIDSGRLGKLLSFDFKYLHNSCIDPERSAGWKQDKNVCGEGTLFDLGAHVFDLCRYLCGDFLTVYAKEQICFEQHKSKQGGFFITNSNEACYTVATLECGAVGTLTVGKVNIGENDGLTFHLFGTKGSIKFDLMEPSWLYYYDSTTENTVRGYTRIECVGRYPYPGGLFPSSKAPVGWLRGHIASMYEFLNSIYSNSGFTPSFDDGAKVQRLLCAAHESAVCGAEIKV